MTNIGRQGEISWRGKWAALGGNGQKVQGVYFGGGIGSFKNRYKMVRSNGNLGCGLSFRNHRSLRGKLS